MVEFDRSAFIGKFQEEAGEYLQRLNEGVITLEADPKNRELIDQMLRDAHTLKGSSRMVGLIEISDVAHRLEDIMVKVRDGEMLYEPSMSDSFFEALDMIVFLCDNAGQPVSPDVDIAGLTARLTAVAETGDASNAATGIGSAIADSEPGAEAEGSIDDPAAPSDEPQRAKREEELRVREQATIRIRTAQLDSLLNLVSEVVIAQIKSERRTLDLRCIQSSLVEAWQAWARVKATVGQLDPAEGRTADLLEEVGALDAVLSDTRRVLGAFVKDRQEDVSRGAAVVSDLQEQGMKLRMLPVSTIFNTYPRAIRDLAHDFKKEVDLVIEGADTELDKKVLEEINDPLIHIMRNAVDHGVESPEVREKAGKARAGTIRMAARQEGDHIVIEISDDGAGIDPDRVRAAAVRKGYISESEAMAMSDREATYLIFESGFSTAAIITEISGRGVGMDVVRRFVVDKLKGSLDVESGLGKGTTFRLTIPLTLAIIRALLMRVGDRLFAIPTQNIDETLRVSPAEILKAEGRDVIRRQRRTVPIVRLGDIVGVAHAPSGTKVPIATIGFSGHRMGFVVDSFVGEQQIVIKTLGSHLKRVENVAGVTVLGAGEVVVILNVPDLMANARTRAGVRVRDAGAQAKAGPKRILICEDSFTTRELERSIFEAAGYDVEVAMDGAQGLTLLRQGLQVEAVVTDVQMPNMTGFELTKAIKADPLLERIPVVIVTSLERDEEKAEGIDAGADAYITKSVFNQDTLLETVERLIR
jgi:two-component system chemotaxis sensor kinase CheA